MHYWINTVSQEHVLKGVKGGFTQAGHGKNSRLKQLSKGDMMIFYSPRTKLKDGEKLQVFTAIGLITDEEPYQAMRAEFHPWRRNVAFLECRTTPIRPLIEKLNFIENKRYWGFPFRQGLFKIGRTDFKYIAAAMQVTR